ncbi:hypothetical protein BOTBODRAFT_53290 [Botryobasidium botryosum FD-172 SS1]|uniref:PCI domain-containing protein n=1 Tax=Botryobasidium botryosum (strain FD-172 SS1) TaxID=930990 RepID=A0A067N1W6_BOTB1|nr:hypothetical protein BOTBODRAFT_53290 [Botryobasidium botryosum FD-172 SS1]
MSEPKKQEKDFTPEVDALIPEAKSLAEAGRLQEAVDKLLGLEKQTRNAADLAPTTRLLTTITNLCYSAKDYDALSANITLLSKKHGQLKESVKVMVEEAMSWLEPLKQEAGEPKWLQLVETLRGVTEGKIFLETPRARVTLLLAKYHEHLSQNATATSTPSAKDSLQTASDLLSDLQVETYSSMDRREKTEFLIEQMRLLVLVARVKDAERKAKQATPDKEAEGKELLVADGEAEWLKVRVGGRKVNEGFLTEPQNEVLRLTYYDLMIQFALHGATPSYLDAAKYYYKVWETPNVKEDVDGKGRQALEHIVYYVILAPHDNEQSDMLHKLAINPALSNLELHNNLVKCFTTRELMRWPGIESIYGPTLRATAVYGSGGDGAGDKRWEDLHTRVIEHNIRVISHYYTRITLPRLTSLLDLSQRETEDVLCRLVVDGTVHAKIDRPAGIVSFRGRRGAEDVMNEWATDVGKLMGLVEKTWMGMNAALAGRPRSS